MWEGVSSSSEGGESLPRFDEFDVSVHVGDGRGLEGDDRARTSELLVVCLLEKLCLLSAGSDAAQARGMVRIAEEQLVAHGLLSPGTVRPEAATIRATFERALTRLLESALRDAAGAQPLALVSGSPDAPRLSVSNAQIRGMFQTSRFAGDFTELAALGRGGFGSVSRVRHQLDMCEYAVKRVRFRPRRLARITRVLREVTSLAALDHPNIVRYHAAWLEWGLAEVGVPEAEAEETSGPPSPVLPMEPLADGAIQPLQQTQVTLFIQMQLCDRSLAQWIEARGGDAMHERGAAYFEQLVEAVAYVHRCGLIHRDLKPQNIFLKGDTVKLGDFGLATAAAVTAEEDAEELLRTSGVGTSSYASPEQLGGTEYDHKADIFSLGVVLLELLCPVATGMERALLIRNGRGGRIPPEVLAAHPEEAALVLWLVAEDPRDRPTAAQVLARLRSGGEGGIVQRMSALLLASQERVAELTARVAALEASI